MYCCRSDPEAMVQVLCACAASVQLLGSLACASSGNLAASGREAQVAGPNRQLSARRTRLALFDLLLNHSPWCEPSSRTPATAPTT